MGRIAIVVGGEVRPLAGGMWRVSCRACDVGALFDTDTEAADALEEHLREQHNLRALNDHGSTHSTEQGANPEPRQRHIGPERP